MEEVKYVREVSALGRNGRMKQVGLDVYRNGHEIWLQPINTQGVGRARLEIPIEQIGEVIAALRAEAGPNRAAPTSSVVQPVRIKVVAMMCDNVSYIVIRDGKVSYSSAGGTPEALGNMFQDAERVRFCLEDAGTPEAALAECRKAKSYAKSFELI